MKLGEALLVLQQASSGHGAEPLLVFLACGFTPLHLQTLLAAEMQVRFPLRRVEIETGLYGDLIGSIEAIAQKKPGFAAIVVEWPDLDPRLGVRNPSGWSPSDQKDILCLVDRRLVVMAGLIDRLVAVCPVALALPTLPLPPVAFTPNRLGSEFQFRLQERLHTFASHCRANVLSPQELDRCSPTATRWDISADLFSGFPYKTPHAAQVASLLAQLLYPPAPKKGIITDLDDTLWSGILGEIGESEISWDLDHHQQHHGLYQLLLRSLAETGVLVGVASKNDSAMVQKAFARTDMLLPANLIFPFEVHWERKSLSVARILKCWKIDADSVVFVDDSPIELAEVQAAFPALECTLFPRGDAVAIVALLYQLRDLFGKSALTAEDTLRRESLREGQRFQSLPENADAGDALLRDARAEITISYQKDMADPRPLELVNKTNQFNLNGRRWTHTEWRAFLESPDAFQMVISYKDKYSVLGKIAVLGGHRDGLRMRVEVWVMSCRAFSRRIEYGCLAALLEHSGANGIILDFAPSERNGPVRDFLGRLTDAARQDGAVTLSAADFRAKCPVLYHQVLEIDDER